MPRTISDQGLFPALERVALVVVETDEGDDPETVGYHQASGYLLDSCHVITAAHAVQKQGVNVNWIEARFFRFEGERLVEERVKARADRKITFLGDRLDMALLKIAPEDIAGHLSSVAPVRYGHLPRSLSGRVPVMALGFPRFNKYGPGGIVREGYSDVEASGGTVTPMTKAGSGMLAFQVESTIDGTTEESPWEGMSGAVLWSESPPRALGVVIEHHSKEGRNRLQVQPFSALFHAEATPRSADWYTQRGLPTGMTVLDPVRPPASASGPAPPVRTPLVGYPVPSRWQPGTLNAGCGTHTKTPLDMQWVLSRQHFLGVVGDLPEADLTDDLDEAERRIGDRLPEGVDKPRRWRYIDLDRFPVPGSDPAWDGSNEGRARQGFVLGLENDDVLPLVRGWVALLQENAPGSPVVVQYRAATLVRIMAGVRALKAELPPESSLSGEPTLCVTRLRPGQPDGDSSGDAEVPVPLLPHLRHQFLDGPLLPSMGDGLRVLTPSRTAPEREHCGWRLRDSPPGRVADQLIADLREGWWCEVTRLLFLLRDLAPEVYRPLITGLARREVPAHLRETSLVAASLFDEDLDRWLRGVGDRLRLADIPAAERLPAVPGIHQLPGDAILCALLRHPDLDPQAVRAQWSAHASAPVSGLAALWTSRDRPPEPARLWALRPDSLRHSVRLWDGPALAFADLDSQDWTRPQVWACLSTLSFDSSSLLRILPALDDDALTCMGLLPMKDATSHTRRETYRARRRHLQRPRIEEEW